MFYEKNYPNWRVQLVKILWNFDVSIKHIYSKYFSQNKTIIVMKTFKNTLAKMAITALFASASMATHAQIPVSFHKNLPLIIERNEDIPNSRLLTFEAEIYQFGNEEMIGIRFGKTAGKGMRITLFDTENNALFTTILSKNETGFYKQDFEIKDLEVGSYRFVLQSGTERLEKKFEIRQNSSQMLTVK